MDFSFNTKKESTQSDSDILNTSSDVDLNTTPLSNTNITEDVTNSQIQTTASDVITPPIMPAPPVTPSVKKRKQETTKQDEGVKSEADTKVNDADPAEKQKCNNCNSGRKKTICIECYNQLKLERDQAIELIDQIQTVLTTGIKNTAKSIDKVKQEFFTLAGREDALKETLGLIEQKRNGVNDAK